LACWFPTLQVEMRTNGGTQTATMQHVETGLSPCSRTECNFYKLDGRCFNGEAL